MKAIKSRRPTTNLPSSHCRRRGQALIEFAVIAFVMTFLLGAMLAMGFLFFSANVLQQAADVGAMEFARHPETPIENFDNALDNSGLFTEAALVVPVGIDSANLPLINQLLFSIYIYDPDIDMLRYPGTLVMNGDGDQTVIIPLVGQGNRNATTGVETITEWRKVVEEIIPDIATEGAYSLDSTTTGSLEAGTVALRINYPYQSAAFVAYVQTDADGNPVAPIDTIGQDGILNNPVIANDNAVTGASSAEFPNGQTLASAGYTLVNPVPNPITGASQNRGQYGFGELQAYSTTVRPYRKVITAQGIYRREVFAAP